MSPGKAYKVYIKELQNQKGLTKKITIGEGLSLDLSNPSEKFIFNQMDVQVLKEVILNKKASVYFLISWPLKSISLPSFLNTEERHKLKKKILSVII